MKPTESEMGRDEIEIPTDKVISIETSPTPENISKCNQQLQSLLFKILPAEIRNDIFSLALLQYEDLANPYSEHDFCYRPGHRARRIVSTDLLLTCRRVWLEANHWPMEQAVHSFWFDADRRPAWTKSEHNSGTFHDDRRFLDFVKISLLFRNLASSTSRFVRRCIGSRDLSASPSYGIDQPMTCPPCPVSPSRSGTATGGFGKRGNLCA
jgi:hypothetical protein